MPASTVSLRRGGQTVHAALTSARGWLPRGNLLSEQEWAQRHRLITAFALAQAVGLAVFGMVIGRGPVESGFALVVTASPALVGTMGSAPRQLRMLSVVVSLMFASMSLVDLTGGIIEMHFHFFVMLGIVALYQDWPAFGLCVLLTFAHHALMGVFAPQLVFIGDLERDNPVRWAMIHSGFVLAASITHVIAWKLNEHQELHDSLTRLPNRQSFVLRLLGLLRETKGPVSVLYIDLDNFKMVNDAHGHRVGDIAMYQAAQTMAETAGGRHPIARLSGDEFAIVMAGPADDGLLLAQRIVTALADPILVEGRELFVTVSIGVADTVLAGTRSPEALVRDADLAMNLAKSSGKSQVVCYTAGVDKAVLDRAELMQDLRVALDLDQFEVHYQPTFTMAGDTAQLSGVEALLRWRHPQRGLVSPVEFIPLAEESGEIKAIGAWVLRESARQVASWQRELPGCAELELAVNLSPAQLRDPELLTFIGAALHESGLATGCLILEVTETMLLSDLDRARRQLDAVRRLGARVAIDDFGTGYSSLSYLARLPADQVKIDRSFVMDLTSGAASVALVRSIIELAVALGLDIQAEGVEEIAQQHILSALGCPRSQGYLYSRPLPPEEFARFAPTVPAVPVGGALPTPAGRARRTGEVLVP